MTMTTADLEDITENVLAIRQGLIFSWAERTFGPVATSPTERAMRVVEKAIELVQARGIDRRVVDRIVSRVYQRPAGDPRAEVGGLCVTVLAYCEAIEISFYLEVLHEMERVLSLPEEHWKRQHDAETAEEEK